MNGTHTRTLVVFAVLTVTIVAHSAFAQAPQAPVPVPASRPTGTAIIRGHITAADTGKPLIRVRVSLTPVVDGASQGYERPVTTSTTTSGRFEFTDVPPGTYRVGADRGGYVAVQWGQHRPRETGQTLDVKNAQTIDRIDIALPKAGVLAGRLTDELGQPYPGVRVEAFDLRYFQGSTHRVAFPGAAGATTDDRGQFRISGLQPGSYQVVASSSERWLAADKQTLGYAGTAFPGVPSDQAPAVTLGVGQQRTNLDFSMLASSSVRVTGRVQNESGQPLAGENVVIGRELVGTGAVSVTGGGSVRTNRDGTFEIRDVMPGTYRVSTSRRAASGQTESMALHVVVGNADVPDLLLVPRSASTITGTVVVDDAAAGPSFTNLRVLLVPGDVDKVMSTVRVQPVNPDGSFRLLNVGGPFLFRLSGLAAGWMIKSVHLNDTDITEVPLDVPTGGKEIPGLQITITPKMATVSGDIVDANRKPTADAVVVIFPDDAALWVPASRFVRVTRPTADAHFSIGQLPAGKYHGAARDFIEDGQENDPEFLESLRAASSTFELLEGGSNTLTLKLASDPPR
jgi:hypothetical protein